MGDNIKTALIFIWGAIPAGSHVLLLVMYSGITPGHTERNIWMPWIKPWRAACKARATIPFLRLKAIIYKHNIKAPKKSISGFREREYSGDRIFVFHMVHLGFIPGISYGDLSTASSNS